MTLRRGYFSAPTRVVTGLSSLSMASDLLGDLGSGPVALVCDRGVAESGLLDHVRAAAAPEQLQECSWIEPDPTFADAEKAVAEARATGCTRVLGVGGGSGLGVAKAVALRLTNDVPLHRLEGRNIAERRTAPCVAIPTTAGSGSEVSNAFVLKRDDDSVSQAIVRGEGYEPRVAILDGRVLRSLPAVPMLYAGLDALSHALEAQWARGSTRFSGSLGLAAARHIVDVLPRAIADRAEEDLQVMIEASAMANLACGSAGLGLAHALSAASSVHLPHGYQNGVLLPHVAAFNAGVIGSEAAALVGELDGLYLRLSFPAQFRPGELTPEDAEAMVGAASDHVFRANNQRESTLEDLRSLLAAAGAPKPIAV